MRELIAWGVDGICTDVPDVALAVRAGAGGELTPG
jgi:glycerophosphoryl diester phosphodiesterase